MQVSTSTNQAIADLAESLVCLSKAMEIIAGDMEEVTSRLEHIEEYLESLEIEEEADPMYGVGILPCGLEGESEERQKQLEEIDLSE